MPDSALMPLKKAYYARIFRRSDGKEEPELSVLADLVAAGDYVLDIGANIGIYTKRMSELTGPNGKVISMEPVPATFEILSSNVRALKLGNVRCLNAAASDHTGLVKMEVPKYDTGWSNIYRARIVDNSCGTIQAISLDEAFRDLNRLDFIKCDVEGHELSVLRGATCLIQKHHPKWLIEVGGDPDAEGTESWQCFQLLAGFEYRVFIANGAGLYPRERGQIAVNYFFL
jgi:FkbM family methyltransferase